MFFLWKTWFFTAFAGTNEFFSLTGSSDFHGEKTLDHHFSVFPNFVKRCLPNGFIFGLRLRLGLRQFSPRRTRERIFFLSRAGNFYFP